MIVVGGMRLEMQQGLMVHGHWPLGIMDGRKDGGQVQCVLQSTRRRYKYCLDTLEGGKVVDGTRRIGQIEGFWQIEAVIDNKLNCQIDID